jgi:predicted ATPase/DNA-binding XRE family transcriptional regulator
MQSREPFGAVLRRLRIAAGLTHEALAERAGLGARTISDLERGISRAPRADTLALLVEGLGLSPEQCAELEAAARAAPISTPEPVPTNLPPSFTTFVDREDETRALGLLLRRDEIRLVTLTGPGGVGKTRLALHVAAGMGDSFPGGIFLVSLAAVAESDGIVQAIGRAIDAEAATRPTLPSLIARIGTNSLLLVLDNCEHLPDTAAFAAELLRGATGLTLLATSRAPLHVSGEQEYPVSPLPVPDPSQPSQVSSLASSPAVALFVDRATRVRPDFTLDADNAAAVAVICARLDGLPLAVELAAARIKALPPRVLTERLGDATAAGSLKLLTGGAIDSPKRHQTLHDTIAWSHDLLSDVDRVLFRRLAVFIGGCTLESAEEVCGVESEDAPTLDVLEGLASLVDKSLLVQTVGPDAEPRYVMLETIRAYALGRLEAAGEVAPLRERHARHYLALVEATGALLFAQAATRARLAAEDGNVQAALRWLVQGS